MPSNDLFESQKPPAEVSVVQTRSKGQPISNEFNTTQTLGGISTLDHRKASIPENHPNWIKT
jgi:hypothetical protein